ncbi:mannitol-1-phosphate 5-dehydrogenase [Desmospora profundinema]|uniref:Mannitol-1-phosphate 5-dehydrogenase n=1 Tax=Desmospora profundinema TaxID=1571184 RepID=A0ABU1IKI4_9BACL|nr:mannitol-1-phosphate 5-dehydrogenase [Desmospora profundinema]MDR6224320.1 mannitol-1-phosphate 5-dehydrogenase [Desmospora profundinema]
MRAVHFGAGNIGRGFIGERLARSGYEVCFVDVQAPLVRELRKRGRYSVRLLGEQVETIWVTGVTALDSRTELDQVVEAIAGADLVTTAVGPAVMQAIAPLLAEGIRLRLRRKSSPLNVVACENMLGASSLLKEQVANHLSKEELEGMERTTGFPDAAVDRIVPVQAGTDLLTVSVEPFHEWVMDRSGIKGDIPPIDGVTYVDSLPPYIERKLYTVNTGHAVCAYVGQLLECETVREAITHPRVEAVVTGVLEETGALLVAKHGFDVQTHRNYIAKIITRFANPHLTDPVSRVGRSPIRKLGRADRLVGPALQMIDRGLQPDRLAAGIAAVFFFHAEQDPESVKLQQLFSQKGVTGTLQTVAGIPEDSPLIPLVSRRYHEWEEEVQR